MVTRTYNIAGVDVPYNKDGIDQNQLRKTIGKISTVYRTNGKKVKVEILAIEWDLSLRYRELDVSTYVGKCYWYRFWRKQNRPL